MNSQMLQGIYEKLTEQHIDPKKIDRIFKQYLDVNGDDWMDYLDFDKTGSKDTPTQLSNEQSNWLIEVDEHPHGKMTDFQRETVKTVLGSGRYNKEQRVVLNQIKQIYIDELE